MDYYVQGQVVLIDEEDYESVEEITWYISEQGYATHRDRQSCFMMQQHILDYYGPLVIDHRDRNRLNNQKSNLRKVERWLNNLNAKAPITNTSGIKGVSQNTTTGMFEAYISIKDRRKHIGTFKTLDQAASARRAYELAIELDPTIRDRAFDGGRSNNKSGVVGVCYVTNVDRWKAKIGKRHLGFFKTKEEAVAARYKAEQELNAGTI